MFKRIGSIVILCLICLNGHAFAENIGPFYKNILFEDYKLFNSTNFKCSIVKGEITDNEISTLESEMEWQNDSILKSFYGIKISSLKGDPKKSYQLLESLVKNIKPQDNNYLYEAYNLKGLILTKLKKYNEAETNFKKCLSLKNINSEKAILTYNNLMYLFRISNKLKEAESIQDKILQGIDKSIYKGIL